MATVSRVRFPVYALALAGLLLALLWLGRAERAGPPRLDVELAGRVPATLFLPGPAERAFPSVPLPRGERPPVVVLVHGFAADRAMVSTLARRLASNGYAVLTPDLRGHGRNPHPFPYGFGIARAFEADLGAAVEHARASPFVDGRRIALIGHSVGAGAVLDYATRDPGLDAVVPISGGFRALGPHRPPNALFLWAEGDPAVVRASSRALAAHLAGRARIELGRTYGAVSRLSATRAEEVAGADHVTILYSRGAASRIVAWLDGVFGVRRDAPLELDDPRAAPVGLGLAAVLIVLVAAGEATGRLAPAWPERGARSGTFGLIVLGVALAASLPLLATGSPASFVPLVAAEGVLALLGLAGVAALAALALGGGIDARALSAGGLRTVAAGGAGALAILVVLTPFGVVGHDLTLTPERARAALPAFAWLLPFSLAFELLLRRGGVLAAALLGVAGRLLVLVAIALGVEAGILPGVVALMLGALAALFVLIEIVAAAVYAVSRNTGAVAVLEAAWLAAVLAAVLPMRA